MLDTDNLKTVFFDLGNTIINYHGGGLSDAEKDSLGLSGMYEQLKKWNMNIKYDVLKNDFFDK